MFLLYNMLVNASGSGIVECNRAQQSLSDGSDEPNAEPGIVALHTSGDILYNYVIIVWFYSLI